MSLEAFTSKKLKAGFDEMLRNIQAEAIEFVFYKKETCNALDRVSGFSMSI